MNINDTVTTTMKKTCLFTVAISLLCFIYILTGCGSASDQSSVETSQTETLVLAEETSDMETESPLESDTTTELETEIEAESVTEEEITEVTKTLDEDAQEWIYEQHYYIRDDDDVTMQLTIMNDVVLDAFCESTDGTSIDYFFELEPEETGEFGQLVYQDGEGTVLTYYSFEGFIYLSAADDSLSGYYLAGSSFAEDWYKQYSEFQNYSTKDTVVVSYSDFGERAEYLEFIVNDTGLVYCYADTYSKEADGGYLYTSEIGGGTAEYYPDDGNYLVITFNGESTTYQNGIRYERTDETDSDNTDSDSNESVTYTMTDSEYNAVYSAVLSYSWTGASQYQGLASVDSIKKVGDGTYYAHVNKYYSATSSLTIPMTVVVVDYGLGGYKGTTFWSGWK